MAARKKKPKKSKPAAPSPRAASPAETLSPDPGDVTQRNFRYQHAYGVILLTAAYRGDEQYVAIYCEHHEDYIAERSDGRFDAYQVKTREPGLHRWRTTDEDFRKTIRRFVELARKHPGRFVRYRFVSNLSVDQASGVSARSRSPRSLQAALASGRPLQRDFKDSADALCAECSCTLAELKCLFANLEFVVGPGRDSFEAEIVTDHLSPCEGCSCLFPAQLNALRDELIHSVYVASSLSLRDPAKHFVDLLVESAANPVIQSKRIAPEVVASAIAARDLPFRFLPGSSKLPLSGTRSATRLEQKFERAGLSDQVETMRGRALAAERALMRMAYSDAERAGQVLDQLAGLVSGACDDAELEVARDDQLYGRAMLRLVQGRLREAAANKALAMGQPYECLVGVAGLLTDECRVWWGKRFAVGGDS